MEEKKHRRHSLWSCCIFVAFVILSLLIVNVSSSGSHASIKSKYGQLVTSSTLRWRHIMSGSGHGKSRIPKGAVPSGTGNHSRVVCRAEHHGTLLVGQTTIPDERCAIGFVNKIYKKHKYAILINTDRAARLEWRGYNTFAGVPEGAVAAVDESSGPVSGDKNIFIGRHLGKRGRWRPGAVEVPRRSSYSTFGVMRVFDQAQSAKGIVTEEEHSNGDILVEVEPVRYELDIHDETNKKWSKYKPKETKEDVILVKSSLFRFNEGRDAEARLQKVLSYAYEKSEYYGQIPGMIRALPTTIRLSNGETQSVLWGLPEKSEQRETMMVGHKLKHRSAVDVTIVGEKTIIESPYGGTLTSIFPDGTKRRRNNVQGVLQRKYLNKIRPEYSRVYQIKDSIAVSEKNGSKDNLSTKREYNDKRSSHIHGHSRDETKDHYINKDWDNTDNRKRTQMLSDQMTQKTSTRKSEKEQELPLISITTQNSAHKQLNVSNITILVVNLLILFSTVLSVNLCKINFIM